MSNTKDKEKEDNIKEKNKDLSYKLQSNIESSIHIQGILEERILNVKIEFTLEKTLDIAKKDFDEFIIDVIKKKRQIIAKIVMARTIDTLMTK